MKSRIIRTMIALFAVLLVPALAPAGDFGYNGWGPRVAVSSDPDQVVGGVQVDFGEFAPNVRLQPSVELGFGDDVTTLIANGMVAYYFPVDAPVTPYAGGALTVAFYDFDSDCKGYGKKFFGKNEDGCDTEIEIGPTAVGGVEWDLESGSRFLAELSVGFSDLPEVKITAGWTF